MEQATRAGALLAERAKDAGIESVVFDRGGYRYHGRVKRPRRRRPRGRAAVLSRSTLGRHMARARSVNPGQYDLQERVVEINRVAKVVKGGRRFSFTALVVVGDENSVVGVGYGKANEVPLAIQKGVERAKKNLFSVPMKNTTITHEVTRRLRCRARVPEAGLRGHRRDRRRRRARRARAGRHPRRAVEVARDQNPINLVKATITALENLRRPDEVAAAARPHRRRGARHRGPTHDGKGNGGSADADAARRGRPAAEPAAAAPAEAS